MREISGDNPLTWKERIYFMIFNFLRGIYGYGTKMNLEFWHPKKIGTMEGDPARKYAIQFFLTELPRILSIKKIDIFDIGCGYGYIRKNFTELGYSGNYTGIAINKNKEFDKYGTPAFVSSFIKSKIEDYKTNKKYDLIISIFALEHIEKDKIAINKCNELMKSNGIQIHIFPSFPCLFLEPIHGYRVYTPKLVKKIFNKKPFKVYRIGGFFSFLLYFFYITIPVFLLATDKLRAKPQYFKLMKICIKLDKYLPFFSYSYIIVVKNTLKKG